MKTWEYQAVVAEYRSWNGLPSCVVTGGIKAVSAKQAAYKVWKERGHKSVIIFENGKQVFSTINGWNK